MRKLAVLGTLFCGTVVAQQNVTISDSASSSTKQTVKSANTPPMLGDSPSVNVLSPANTGLPVNLPIIVQKRAQVSSGSVASINQAFTSNSQAGNTLAVSFCNGNVNAPTAPITDTQNNTWTKAVHQVNGSAFECDIWYATSTVGGADTITVTPGGTNASIAMEIYEISGLMQISQTPSVVLDQTNSASGSSTSLASGTVTVANPNGLAIAVFGVGTAAQTVTVTGGFTNDSGQQNPTTPAGLFSFVGASRFTPDDFVSLNATGTITSEPWVAAVATFESVSLGVQAVSIVRDAAGNGRGLNINADNSLTARVIGNAGGVFDQATGSAVPANALYAGINVAGNIRGWTGVNPTGAVFAAQVDLASVAGTTALTGNGTTGAGSPRVTVASDNTAFNVQPIPSTSNGLTSYNLQPTASDNHANIKNGAGQVYHISATNNSGTVNYMRLYNAATGFNGCNSATNLIWEMVIPANTSGAGFVEDIAAGIAFSTGISICVTSGYGNTDTTNATATAMMINVGYK